MLRKDWKIKKNPYYVLILTVLVIVGIFFVDKLSNGKYRLKPRYPFKKYTQIDKIILKLNGEKYIIDNNKNIKKLKNLKCFIVDKDVNFDKKNKIIVNGNDYLIGNLKNILEITLLKYEGKIYSYSGNIFKVLGVDDKIGKQKPEKNN